MSTSELELPPLSAEQKRWLESFLRKFEDGWAEGLLAQRARELPPPTSPLRRPLLVALARIDLAQQWRRGRRAVAEAYLKLYPELESGGAPFALVAEEYRQRLLAGAPADLEQFGRRFPQHVERLRQLHEQPTSRAPSIGETLPAVPATCTGPAPAAPGELPETFGRYRIEKKLGQGGMGAVYLAHDTQLGRRVALKVPRLDGDANPEVLQRFDREARAAATLAHPNICPVYDVGEHGGVRYVTMAYVEGRSLAELIRGTRALPQRPVAAVVRKIALALAEAHQRGIVHRDLKPANVMINSANEPVVMDFGLARRTGEDDARLTREGAILGTPAYMPPEQVSGRLSEIGPASDVYSLGVILYEMLTARLPFQGPATAVLAQVLTQEPPCPSTLRPDLDAELEGICLRAMAKKPADRFASMKDFAAALTGYLQRKPSNQKAQSAPAAADLPVAEVAAEPEEIETVPGSSTGGATELLGRLVARLENAPTVIEPPTARRLRWMYALAGLCVAAALLVLALVLLKKSDTEGKPGNNVSVQLGGLTFINDNSVHYYLDGKQIDREELRRGLSLPPGRYELEARRGDKVLQRSRFEVQPGQQEQQIPVVPQDPPPGEVGEMASFLGASGPVIGVAFLPDGKHFLAMDTTGGGGNGSLWLWDTGKRKEDKTWRLPKNHRARPSPGCLAVSLDGEKALVSWLVQPGEFSGVSQRLVLHDLATQKEDFIFDLGVHNVAVSGVAYSPNGDYGLVSTWDAITKVIDLRAAKEVNRLEGGVACYSPDGRRILSADAGNVLWLWDVAGDKVKKRPGGWKGHGSEVRRLAFAPNGRRAVSCDTAGSIRLWEVATGKELLQLKGHSGEVCGVVFSPDGRRVLSGGVADSTVRLWDAASGKELVKFEHGKGGVQAVSLSPGGTRALSGGNDRVVRLWQLPP
jgi:hypothetical protein